MIAYGALNLWVLLAGYEWVRLGADVAEIYLRSLAVGCGIVGLWSLLPILLKWLLIGRWKAREFRVWGPTYLRFWIVKTAIRANPLALMFSGSPLSVLYLRALGARIGPGAVILTRNLPVCTDLLTVGAGAVVRADSWLNCYRARDGVIETGPVTLGREAFVGDWVVLDIDTAVGDRAQIGHASSLHAGQRVPAGESWHGTPARPSPATYRLETAAAGRWQMAARRVGYSLVQVAVTVFVGFPLAFGVLEALLSHSRLAPLLHPTLSLMADRSIYAEVALAVVVLFYGGLGLALLVVATVPRLPGRLLVTGRVYPLYGFHYGLQRLVARMTNVQLFTETFGDASAIVGYLGRIGYRLRPVEQTGSNFGQMVKHENPYLCTVGRGTVVADGLSILNADYCATAFRLREARIGAHSFLGNHIVYPAGGRTGDNVLLATKVAVPLDGPVRGDVGLLGSPAFEIPRTVRRDADLGVLTRAELRRQLRAKNRHNAVTMALYLAIRCLLLYLAMVLTGVGLEYYSDHHGPIALVGLSAVLLVVPVACWVVVERLYSHLQVLAPRGISIYDPTFWRHERYWKGPGVRFQLLFDGTPLKPVIWRLLGVRVGRGLFDDGLTIPERRFASIGAACTFNAGSVLQCHSQEDGAFKSDRSSVGDRCTVGVGSLVHYGVRIGDDVELAPDSFVMKGEEVPDGDRWLGNPAHPMSPGQQLPAGAAPAPTPSAHPAIHPGIHPGIHHGILAAAQGDAR